LNVLGKPPPPPQLLRTSSVLIPVEDVHVPPQGTLAADPNQVSTKLGGDAVPPRASQSNPGWDSDSDSSWSESTISNAPSDPKESLSERPLPRAADNDLKDEVRVSRRISGSAGGVDMANAAQMELRSAVDSDPGP
jgi:hypothetical protein